MSAGDEIDVEHLKIPDDQTGSVMCLESSPAGLACTRTRGHKSRHAAAGGDGFLLSVWGEP